MKNILIFTISLFTLFSCSSDNNNTSQDNIVGTWTLFSVIDREVSDCEKQSTIIFNSDGTNIGGKTYDINPVNNNCESSGETMTFRWINIGNDTYEIKNLDGTITNNGEWKISFSDNNNTMKITNFNIVYKRAL